MFSIVTWNINGIRSSQQDLKSVFDSLECDVLCLQETKITRKTSSHMLSLNSIVDVFFYCIR